MIYIVILVIISSLIAYLGDVLGTYVGKKRLTVLGLRPRVTAVVVAISTGIFITLLTLGVMTILSEDVRTALFHMNSLRQDLESLQNETRGLEQVKLRLEKDKVELTQDVERLTTTVRIKETGSVAFRKDEPLAVTIIPASQSINEVMKQLTTLVINLTGRVRRQGVKVEDEINFFTANKKQLDGMAAHIASSTQDMVVGAIAAENINAGEQLGNVRFILLPNDRIFQKNQSIASIQIDGRLDRGKIARNLKQFMDEINQEVVNLGMIANPLTGRFGDLSSDSMLSFYDMVNRIKDLDRQFILIAVVLEDTYAIGPLNVSFRFEETGESILTTKPKVPDKEPVDK
ncbi:MAG: DUF3084 domain-containing protein [Candidatus Riflebacteria bacterium]|nr:DUF3084 domain-containing protein [Candidatus Riflebacteria bacterium]